MDTKVKKVVIVGGGTAGWISASLLVKMLGKFIDITLVESEAIGTVGVGEATIPPIINFNAALGIDEAEFVKATNGSIKLGIQFENWNQIGDSYMHAFGNVGKDFPFCAFHHIWLRGKELGLPHSFWDFSLNYQTAIADKFAPVNQIAGTNLPGLAYAYHFDASLYAKFLRRYSETRGVTRIEGKVSTVQQCKLTGNVKGLVLEGGQSVEGDLFIDCTGLHGLLIDKTLNTGFEDWSHWLPNDSAVAVPTASTEQLRPYTRSIARENGWQWQIPLQHRVGNGFVYSSKYLSDDDAKQTLLDNLESEPLAEPRIIKFKTGRRLKQWNRNVVSIGLSSGFLEPLESTSIHLIQSGITRLIKAFPHNGLKSSEIEEFNRQSKTEFERIRDFIILHYKKTSRDDSQYWRDLKSMDIPQSLKDKVVLFEQTGKVYRDFEDLFTEIGWIQVMMGQGVIPKDYHPLANQLSKQQIEELYESLQTLIAGTVKPLPTHKTFLNGN